MLCLFLKVSSSQDVSSLLFFVLFCFVLFLFLNELVYFRPLFGSYVSNMDMM